MTRRKGNNNNNTQLKHNFSRIYKTKPWNEINQSVKHHYLVRCQEGFLQFVQFLCVPRSQNEPGTSLVQCMGKGLTKTRTCPGHQYNLCVNINNFFLFFFPFFYALMLIILSTNGNPLLKKKMKVEILYDQLNIHNYYNRRNYLFFKINPNGW